MDDLRGIKHDAEENLKSDYLELYGKEDNEEILYNQIQRFKHQNTRVYRERPNKRRNTREASDHEGMA